MSGPMKRALVRVGAMAMKETLHVLRDPRTLALALVMPVVMLFLFGYGVSFDLDRIPIAIADADRTDASRRLVRAVTASRELVSTRPSAKRPAISLPPVFESETNTATCRVTGSAVAFNRSTRPMNGSAMPRTANCTVAPGLICDT